MRILVTGGAGYVGSVCAAELLRRRHWVIAYDDLSTGHRKAVSAGVKFIQGDVGDGDKLQYCLRRFRVEAVMHFAASALVEESMRNPQRFYQNNVAATLTLLEAMGRCGVKKLVFSSSAAVYGEPDRVPIPETHPTRPVNAYGETKLAIERALPWYHRAYGLNAVALRYFNAAGATRTLGEVHDPETHLLPRLFEAALHPDLEFRIFGSDYPTADGSCIRDFVHVLDIARAHVLALRKLPGIGFDVYNIGHGRGYSVLQVVREVERAVGRRIRTVFAPRRAGDPAVLLAKATKIRRALGWEPKSSDLPNIVRSGWSWHRRHPHGYS
jgi:UDP-glucose 4-epimerase